MNDLVKRLRARWGNYPKNTIEVQSVDEIERLTAENANLKEQLAAREAYINRIVTPEKQFEALREHEARLLEEMKKSIESGEIEIAGAGSVLNFIEQQIAARRKS